MKGRVLWLVLALVGGAIGVASLAAWGTLRTYHVLTRRDVVAVVECWPSPTRADEFRLVYRPLVGGRPGPAQIFQLAGDLWSIGGDLLVWRGWAQLAGMRTWYKITRIEGRYATAARANTGPPTAYDVNGGSDWLWRFLYRWQAWLPGVEAVYGGSVFLPPDPQKQFIVYATPTGLLVKPQRRRPRYPLPAPRY